MPSKLKRPRPLSSVVATLGLGNTTPNSSPAVVPGLAGITRIAAGYHHSSTLGSGGEVKVWGRNFEGQCGGGTSSPVSHPTPQTLGGLPATPTDIACGYHFTVFALSDGSIAGTGSNADGANRRPLVLTTPQLQLDDVALDWQHFNNSGNFQTVDRPADWTVSVTGSASGVIGSTTAADINAISGVETLEFSPPPTLTDAETYQLMISVTGSNSDGNNTGLDAMTINGVVVSDGNGSFNTWIANPAFGLAPGDRGFGENPDGDELANGLEAWFGTHPGEPSTGLTGIANDGVTTTFTHPRNQNPPPDLAGYYEWSLTLSNWHAGDGVDGPQGGPTVSISANPDGAHTTVTSMSSEPLGLFFLRAGVRQNQE